MYTLESYQKLLACFSGDDPGFLERGFICIKVYMGAGGARFADSISFFLNIP